MHGSDNRQSPNTNVFSSVRLGNKAIALKLCKNVLIRDVTIFHGGHFAVLVTGCDNLTVDHVTMDTNRDGIDIDCCRNTMASNCRINSPGHDGLCPRALMRWAKHASRKISAVGHGTITKTAARFGAELDAATAVFDRYHGAVKQCAFLKTQDPMLER